MSRRDAIKAALWSTAFWVAVALYTIWIVQGAIAP